MARIIASLLSSDRGMVGVDRPMRSLDVLPASVRIVDAAGLRGERHWETVVVKSNQANAFVMPNGKIVVFTGILSVAKTEAALGAVIGHEVGHVVGRHAAERMSQALLVQLGAASVDAALAAGNNAKYRPVVGAALGLGAQYGSLRCAGTTRHAQ